MLFNFSFTNRVKMGGKYWWINPFSSSVNEVPLIRSKMHWQGKFEASQLISYIMTINIWG